MKKPVLLLSVLVAATTLTLAGCGGGGSSSTPTDLDRDGVVNALDAFPTTRPPRWIQTATASRMPGMPGMPTPWRSSWPPPS
jgi:hypothetical protein